MGQVFVGLLIWCLVSIVVAPLVGAYLAWRAK